MCTFISYTVCPPCIYLSNILTSWPVYSFSTYVARLLKVGPSKDGGFYRGMDNKIEVLGLDEMVDDIVGTDELGGVQFRKPCDIAFRIMVNKWLINPADIVYVGDNISKDFQVPHQLKMKSLFYKNIK